MVYITDLAGNKLPDARSNSASKTVVIVFTLLLAAWWFRKRK